MPLLVPAEGNTNFELRNLPVQSGMVLFWQKAQHSGVVTANLWKSATRREAGQGLSAVLQQKGLTRVSDWVRTDISTPLPALSAIHQWGPPGARNYPQNIGALSVCRANASDAPAGMHFVDLGKAVQPCILSWGAGPDLLILGDMDLATLQRFGKVGSSSFRQVKLAFAPASFATAERAFLAGLMPNAAIHYAGDDPSGVWSWQNRHFVQSVSPVRAYWQIED